MGLNGQPAFNLDQVIQLIKLIHGLFDPPYAIILYSLSGMGEVQRGVDEAVNNSLEENKEKLQVAKFIMVKVSGPHN